MSDNKSKSGRLLAIDGMRGVAALAVVLFHLSGNMNEVFHQSLPEIIATALSYGYLGVPIFFVLSGFVISHAVDSERISLSYVGSFIVRRSVRLDPPYWAAIGLAVLMLLIKENVVGVDVNLPSPSDVVAHMFYLQDILQIDPVLSSVFWTLCLEIQFYIFFVGSLYLLGKIKTEKIRHAHVFFLLATGVFSLLVYVAVVPFSLKGTFIPYWHFFVSGVIVQRALWDKESYLPYLLGWLLLICVAVLFYSSTSYLITAALTMAIIYIMGITNYLKTGLDFGALQFLGAISYSLYLIHPEIGWKIISVLQSATKNQESFGIQVGIFLVGIGGSILFSYVFYLVIEKTSMQLAKKIKTRN